MIWMNSSEELEELLICPWKVLVIRRDPCVNLDQSSSQKIFGGDPERRDAHTHYFPVTIPDSRADAHVRSSHEKLSDSSGTCCP